MSIGAVLLFCTLFPRLTGASLPQDPSLPQAIDAEVSRIPGFNRATAAPRCDDGEYLRRVMLDLVGFPPTAQETRAFAADPAADKRQAVVDRLLASERFADFWARRWMDVFFGSSLAFRGDAVERLDAQEREIIVDRFRRWLAGRIQRDRAWTDTVTDLLIADGTPEGAPALAYKVALDGWARPTGFEGRAVSHFMGMDASCVGCHDHPFDNWTVDDGVALAAFSSGRKIRWGPKGLEVIEGPEPPGRAVQNPGRALVPAPAFPRGGKPADGEVLARAYARLMVAPANVQFRAAFVNRIWSWLLGRGIVSPVDEFNLKNRPLSPNLLNLLSRSFAANGHSLRFLIRAICASETYQRRSDGPAPYAKVNFSRTQIRPLSAEQLQHSLEVATLGAPRFDRVRIRRLAERMIRGDAPACDTAERTPDVRALAWLAESEEVWTLIREGAVVKAIAAEADVASRVKSMFQSAFSREPGLRELDRYSAFLKDRGEEGLREAYWTLLNSTEFLTRH